MLLSFLRFPLLPNPISNTSHPLSPQPRPRHLSAISLPPSRPRCAAGPNVVIEADGGVAQGEELPAGLRRELLPKHVAVVMDGNRRWAQARGFPVESGYEAGLRALRGLVELCCRWGIRVLTVFAFSSDNWFRPKMEVDFLMSLFARGLKDELSNILRKNIRLSIIGDSSKLPVSLKELIADAEQRTKNNSGLQLIVAVSYSGKCDIVQACQNIAVKVKDGLVEPEDINEFLIEQELQTNCTKMPRPDLLVRTSGELRVSNFLLWQLAYTELYFTESHWPDFVESEFVKALQSFERRQRRYGRGDS